MDLSKICIGLIVLLAFLGVASGAGTTWITANETSVGLSNLAATITLTIKNSGDHVEYFKISNVYTGSLVDNSTIQWVIDSTDPKAVKMVDAVNPQLGGDWGWKVQPGETKTVTFTVHAVGLMGVDPTDSSISIPTVISNANAVDNIYWPIIPDPGLFASWFQPNEIEMLNPNLDLKSWKGTFHFKLTADSRLSNPVSGIIRAPVVPTDSKLIASDPKATFTDKDLVMNGKIAAWDVTMDPGATKWFSYTYLWPAGSSSSSTGKFKSPATTTSAASKTSPLSTKETGIPYGLFLVGGILTAGGLAYARLRK